MAVRRPYYGDHQILAGRYTPGNEYVLENGDEYIGTYHVLPNGQLFTGSNRNIKSKQLFEKRQDLSEDVRVYNRLKGLDVSKYQSPVLYQPRPTEQDYTRGFIQRYFVQKRNSPENTNVEIDSQQYNSVNTENNPGINGVIWKRDTIPWRISLVSKEDARVLNRIQVERINKSLIGVKIFLNNYLEFYK